MSWSKRILGALILAPILEEGIFRYFLGPFRKASFFKWLYYFSSLVFGWIHFYNFHPDAAHNIFLPIITLPQTSLGFLLGYIRIMYGFWFAVMLHFLYNVIFVGLSFIFD
ncbi:CPBP family intramembrane glutamic endopeptidase [Dyadobacter luteus]